MVGRRRQKAPEVHRWWVSGSWSVIITSAPHWRLIPSSEKEVGDTETLPSGSFYQLQDSVSSLKRAPVLSHFVTLSPLKMENPRGIDHGLPGMGWAPQIPEADPGGRLTAAKLWKLRPRASVQTHWTPGSAEVSEDKTPAMARPASPRLLPPP